MNNLEIQKKFCRLHFETAINNVFFDVLKEGGIKWFAFLLEESPSILKDYIERHNNDEYKNLLSEQGGNTSCNGTNHAESINPACIKSMQDTLLNIDSNIERLSNKGIKVVIN